MVNTLVDNDVRHRSGKNCYNILTTLITNIVKIRVKTTQNTVDLLNRAPVYGYKRLVLSINWCVRSFN